METARDVIIWKEFAMEASRCNGYSELGRMLLKLQKVNSVLVDSLGSRIKVCQFL
jgi:hypothetical protein